MCLRVAGMCPKVAGFMFDDDFLGLVVERFHFECENI
jgi:hypothetical protein